MLVIEYSWECVEKTGGAPPVFGKSGLDQAAPS
jgi:hypothetical protein